MLRSQIGTPTNIYVATGSTTEIGNTRIFTQGSLVIVAFSYDGDSYSIKTTARDFYNVNKWKVIERSGGIDSVFTNGVAYCTNFKGPTNTIIYLDHNTTRYYRYASLTEWTGIDLVDPLLNDISSLIPTPKWIHAPPQSLSIGVTTSYGTQSSRIYSNEVKALYEGTYCTFTSQNMPSGTTVHYVTCGVDNSIFKSIFAFRPGYSPRRKIINPALTSILPTLSDSTFVPNSRTTTGWRPRVTAVFP